MTSEKQFQTQVVELARLSGWLCYHTHDSRRSAPGFPDLVLLKPPRLVFAELKSEKGKVREEQAVWLCALSECRSEPPESYLWRPSDWDEIQKTLTTQMGKRAVEPRQRSSSKGKYSGA